MSTPRVILFNKTCIDCSRIFTTAYSTSFSSAIRLLHPDFRDAIYAIYGFVRLADEIVDSFHEHNKASLLDAFKIETFDSIRMGISLNPVLNSFQLTVCQYNIQHELIDAFFSSMEMDLTKSVYLNNKELDEYIYGSAEVVGLMCLYVFCEGDRQKFESLKYAARALGAAFQKINFLRDLKADYEGLNRSYFPGFDFTRFDSTAKQAIEENIEKDFREAYDGILQLPPKARSGVYVAYKYYYSLFKKIKKLKPEHILKKRVRIPDFTKIMLLMTVKMQLQLKGVR